MKTEAGHDHEVEIERENKSKRYVYYVHFMTYIFDIQLKFETFE